MLKFFAMPIILAVAACASPNPAPHRGVELAQNVPPISITETPVCKKKKLVYEADGSLWIK